MNRLLAVLLTVGLLEAGALAWRALHTPTLTVPLLVPADAPGPAEAEVRLAARAATVGEYLTVEDLARLTLALTEGEVPGAPPLTEAERARLAPLLARANEHRDALLAEEARLAETERALDAEALAILATLDAEQRRWILDHRDRISVGEVEAGYWEALLTALPAPPSPAAPPAPPP